MMIELLESNEDLEMQNRYFILQQFMAKTLRLIYILPSRSYSEWLETSKSWLLFCYEKIRIYKVDVNDKIEGI